MKDAKEIRKMLSIELEIPESRIDWINVRKVEDGVFCVRTGLFKDGSISWNGEERMLGFKKHEGDLYDKVCLTIGHNAALKYKMLHGYSLTDHDVELIVNTL